MRQQRETVGKHAMHILAGYISMFSGQGPFQTGITRYVTFRLKSSCSFYACVSADLLFGHGREIDEALRPGVYSLIDICEESDFQQLHTYLGGP